MKKNKWIATGLVAGLIIGTGLALYLTETTRGKRRRRRISDEGYETAGDILYPSRRSGRKVHYGPVVNE